MAIKGVLTGLIVVLITLLVLGIVTGNWIFYVLFGVLLLGVILSVIGLFTFLKKTGQETSSVRRSTYDIHKSKNHDENLTTAWEKKTDDTSSKKDQKASFCKDCGMRLKSGAKTCSNCGKSV